MLRALALGSCFCVEIAFPAIAEELPKFDGIYLGLKDGTFEKLNPFVAKRIIVRDFGSGKPNQYGVAQSFVPVTIDGVAAESDILSAVFFESADAESIFIRSRSMRLNFIENVVIAQDLFFDFSSDPDSLRREAFYERLSTEFPYIAGTNCGVPASGLSLINESENTYQYFFEGSDLLDRDGNDVQLFYRQGNSCFIGGATDAAKSLGLSVSTNEGDFLLLESDAMRDYYASPALQGWSAIPDLMRKIEAVDR